MTLLETIAIVFVLGYLLCAFIWLATKYDGLRRELDRTNFHLGAALRKIKSHDERLDHLEGEHTAELTVVEYDPRSV